MKTICCFSGGVRFQVPPALPLWGEALRRIDLRQRAGARGAVYVFAAFGRVRQALRSVMLINLRLGRREQGVH